MKKVILFLINGFGIEQRDSYEIYNSELMPTLDNTIKENLFSSLEANDLTLYDAYRTFSTQYKDILTYPFLDQYSLLLKENPNFNSYLSTIKDNSKVHLFCIIDNYKSIEHIRNIINSINKKVVIHLVLKSKDINNYEEINKIFDKITFDIKMGYIGSIVGLDSILNNSREYVAMLKSGIGEKWHEIGKKLESLRNLKTIPALSKGFYVNDDFKVNNDDSILFLNYEEYDFTNFVTNLKEVNTNKIFSIFKIKGIDYPLYAYPTSSISLINDLKSINAKCLMITNGDINTLNYYCNGLKNVNDSSLMFMKDENEVLYNKQVMTNVLNDPKFNLIIINHSIDGFNNINDLKEKLKKIDTSLSIIKEISILNKYTLIISSLYGIKEELLIDQYTKKLVNFSSKVPFIVLDENIPKYNYRLDFGNIVDLKTTCLKLIDLKFKGKGLIAKKTFLDKLFKK